MNGRWKSAGIAAERRKRADTNLATASREELIDRIVALETSLYKLTYTWNELDFDKGPRRSQWLTSPLFPDRNLGDDNEEHDFHKYDAEAGKFQPVAVAADTLHSADFEKQESISVYDGAALSDDLPLIEAHGNATACYINGGAIFMGDVREAARLLWSPVSPAKEGSPPT